jgi:acetylglutamate kinase
MSIVNFPERDNLLSKIETLNELVPNIKKYYGETIVVYYDGEALYNQDLATKFAEDIVLIKQLGVNVVIVHGGEKIINDIYHKINISPKYTDGVRVIDDSAIEIVEMVLSGLVNKKIVANINNAGGVAIGISGKDSNLIEAKKYRGSKSSPNSNIQSIVDLGFTGEPTLVNPDILFAFEDTDFIPVVSPIASGENMETYHINPLTAASVLVSALVVRKFVIMTDHKGIIDNGDSLVNIADYNVLAEMLKEEKSDKEMRHLVSVCINALENKIDTVHVIDGRVPHSLLLNIFTDAESGTLVRNETY